VTYWLVGGGFHALDHPATTSYPAVAGEGEEATGVERVAAVDDRIWCMSEVDIFADLSAAELDVIAAAAPMRTYAAGELLFSPADRAELLFVLKQGRVRLFRVSADGRALTTAILSPGTIFGEMVPVGQYMHDNYAEALDEVVVCVLNRDCVHKYLLSDFRVAARIAQILGERLVAMERRLSDTVFKTVPQRIAATLVTLFGGQPRYRLGPRAAVVAFTHEQIAALAGTSRETTSKVLGDFADRGLVRLGRGKITVLDRVGLQAEAGS
jgi:CRP-like cAMP-binding protein